MDLWKLLPCLKKRRSARASQTVSSPVPEVILEDPDDDKFLACAIDGGADYIVSGDHHLLDLGSYEGIPILRPATFLQIVRVSQA